MSEKFEIGGQCVCTPRQAGGWFDGLGLGLRKINEPPFAGQVLTIVDIRKIPGLPIKWDLFLYFSGIEPWGYDSRDFRPCKKTDISELEKLLTDLPKELETTTICDNYQNG